MAVSPALGQSDPEQNNPIDQETGQKTEHQQTPAKDDQDAPFWKERDGSPETYRAICEKPAHHGQADLCQQWRSAEAASQQVEIARWQLIASIMGVAGLIATIIYTHRTFRLSSHTATRQLRAYVFTTSIRRIADVDGRIAFKIIIKNSGQTPAYNVTSWVTLEMRDASQRGGKNKGFFPSVEDGPFEDGQSRHPIAPGGDHFYFPSVPRLLTPMETDAIKHGGLGIFMWGEINYFDAFGAPRFTRFRVVYSGEASRDGGLHNCEEGNEAN